MKFQMNFGYHISYLVQVEKWMFVTKVQNINLKTAISNTSKVLAAWK